MSVHKKKRTQKVIYMYSVLKYQILVRKLNFFLKQKFDLFYLKT